jgi:hypothetical protein
MEEIRYCRDCKFSQPVGSWQLTCPPHKWPKPKWCQTAEAGDCTDYEVLLRLFNAKKGQGMALKLIIERSIR